METSFGQFLPGVEDGQRCWFFRHCSISQKDARFFETQLFETKSFVAHFYAKVSDKIRCGQYMSDKLRGTAW